LFEKSISDKKIIGIFPGAGNPSRRWSMDNFAQTAKLLSEDKSLQIIVFLGPEEKHLRAEVEEKFPFETIIFDKLSLLEFAAALSKLEILISNDTGAIHIGAIVGASIVVILDERAPITFLPLTEKICAVRSAPLEKISVEEVFQATQKFLRTREVSENEIGKNHQTQAK
jgi:ADP-heptose:LPS heptosyltransferase